MGAARLIIAGFAVLGVLITQAVVGYSAYKSYGRFGKGFWCDESDAVTAN